MRRHAELAAGRLGLFALPESVVPRDAQQHQQDDGEPAGLAAAAEGKVWLATLQPGAEKRLPRGTLLVDQVPEADGRYSSQMSFSSERP